MSQKNHIARIMAVMLVVSVMVSMAGVEGAFEIKVNTVQHSSPLNGATSTNTIPPDSTIPATPAPIVTSPVTPTPSTNQTQLPSPQETVNPTDTGDSIDNQGIGQNDFWALINSMFNQISDKPSSEIVPTSIPTPVPTAVPTTIATIVPTPVPTIVPTTVMTPEPTRVPTTIATTVPTRVPATIVAIVPTKVPTTVATTIATTVPTPVPTPIATTIPTRVPTTIVTIVPINVPTPVPTTIATTVSTPAPTPVPTPSAVSNQEIRGNGTISLVSADGEFFGIVSDDGSHYVPGKIDPLFQVDGLRVTYRVLERHDLNDTHNWGTPVDLLELVQVGRVIEQRIEGNGTIHYEDLEGGFYGIIADNGERYLPVNLDDTFKSDGLRVNFSAYPASVSTISMWGTPVRLVTIILTGEAGPSHIVMTGSIRQISGSSDGGTFGIIGDDGALYIPTELDGAFKQNGLNVTFTAEEVRTNFIIPRNRGIPVNLLDIALYDK